jgi:hypothetical protein
MEQLGEFYLISEEERRRAECDRKLVKECASRDRNMEDDDEDNTEEENPHRKAGIEQIL